jgi:hypothetical protein
MDEDDESVCTFVEDEVAELVDSLFADAEDVDWSDVSEERIKVVSTERVGVTDGVKESFGSVSDEDCDGFRSCVEAADEIGSSICTVEEDDGSKTDD